MKTDKLTNLIGLYLLIGLLAATVLGFFVIKPFYNRASERKAQVEKIKQDMAALEQLEEDTELLRKNYDQVKEQRNEILSLLPAKTEEERLLAVMSSIASNSGVVLTAFAPDANVASVGNITSLSIYPATFTVAGNYSNITNFLTKMEDGARFVDIQGANLVGGGNQGSALSTRLTVNAYYQSGSVEAGGAK